MSERRALAGAGAAHLVLLAALSLGWTAMQKPQPAPDAVAVDLVDISDVPRASAEAREATAPPALAPAPPPAANAAVPSPAGGRVVPTARPPSPEPQEGNAERQRSEGEGAPAPVADTPAPPAKSRPRSKPAPTPTSDQLTRALDKSLAPAPKVTAQTRADPAQLAALLDRTLGKAAAAAAARSRAKPGPQQTAQPANAQLSPLAMATLAQAIAGQIARCWSILPGQQSMTVDLNVRLARDGSVAGPITVVGVTGGANAAAERSFADSARRAVVACAPLHDLPPQSYQLWRELSPLHLDAKDVK